MTRTLVHLVLAAASLSCWLVPARAQIVTGEKPPVDINPNADPKVKLANRFADYYMASRIGEAMRDLADLPSMFDEIFREDWSKSPPEEQAQIKELYIQTMGMAFWRPTTKEVMSVSNVWVVESDDRKAKVSLTFKQGAQMTRFMLKMHSTLGQWKLTDGYTVGEDGWIENMRKAYAHVRGDTTPLGFMKMVNRTYRDMRAGTAATQPYFPEDK